MIIYLPEVAKDHHKKWYQIAKYEEPSEKVSISLSYREIFDVRDDYIKIEYYSPKTGKIFMTMTIE